MQFLERFKVNHEFLMKLLNVLPLQKHNLTVESAILVIETTKNLESIDWLKNAALFSFGQESHHVSWDAMICMGTQAWQLSPLHDDAVKKIYVSPVSNDDCDFALLHKSYMKTDNRILKVMLPYASACLCAIDHNQDAVEMESLKSKMLMLLNSINDEVDRSFISSIDKEFINNVVQNLKVKMVYNVHAPEYHPRVVMVST